MILEKNIIYFSVKKELIFRMLVLFFINRYKEITEKYRY